MEEIEALNKDLRREWGQEEREIRARGVLREGSERASEREDAASEQARKKLVVKLEFKQ